MDRKSQDLKQVGFRLPGELVKRVEAFAQSVERPGESITRSTAVRMLLEKALVAEGFPSRLGVKVRHE